jgi:hypothetical protein
MDDRDRRKWDGREYKETEQRTIIKELKFKEQKRKSRLSELYLSDGQDVYKHSPVEYGTDELTYNRTTLANISSDGGLSITNHGLSNNSLDCAVLGDCFIDVFTATISHLSAVLHTLQSQPNCRSRPVRGVMGVQE